MKWNIPKTTSSLSLLIIVLSSSALADISSNSRFPINDDRIAPPKIRDFPLVPVLNPLSLRVERALEQCLYGCLENIDGENFRMYQFYCMDVDTFDPEMCVQAIENIGIDKIDQCANECISRKPPPAVPPKTGLGE